MNYLYRLEENFTYTCSDDYFGLHRYIKRGTKGNVWMTVERKLHLSEAKITIFKGYAWDGCSPKVSILDLCWLGSPDGVVDYKTGKPKAYYASLVHDALCQFISVSPGDYSRKNADLLFYKMLKEAGFKLAWLYYIMVRTFAILTRKK